MRRVCRGQDVGEVVAELEFVLTGFLRDVDVGAEADAVGKVKYGTRRVESIRLFQY